MNLKDVLQGKATLKNKRSSKWPKIRKQFVKSNPTCAICGSKNKLEVHHVKPFNLHPELELEESNLIQLCENKKCGVVCHLLVGHLGSYRSYNENVREDASNWKSKLENRP